MILGLVTQLEKETRGGQNGGWEHSTLREHSTLQEHSTLREHFTLCGLASEEQVTTKGLESSGREAGSNSEEGGDRQRLGGMEKPPVH